MPEITIHEGFTLDQEKEIQTAISRGLFADDDIVIFRPQNAETEREVLKWQKRL